MVAVAGDGLTLDPVEAQATGVAAVPHGGQRREVSGGRTQTLALGLGSLGPEGMRRVQNRKSESGRQSGTRFLSSRFHDNEIGKK